MLMKLIPFVMSIFHEYISGLRQKEKKRERKARTKYYKRN